MRMKQGESQKTKKTVHGLIAVVYSIQVYVCVCIKKRSQTSANLKKYLFTQAEILSDAVGLVLRWVVLVEAGQILKHHWQLAAFTRSHTHTGTLWSNQGANVAVVLASVPV